MDKFICYCFGYSEADIEQDVIRDNGPSTIMEKIKAVKGMGDVDAMKRIHRGNDAFLISTV